MRGQCRPASYRAGFLPWDLTGHHGSVTVKQGVHPARIGLPPCPADPRPASGGYRGRGPDPAPTPRGGRAGRGRDRTQETGGDDHLGASVRERRPPGPRCWAQGAEQGRLEHQGAQLRDGLPGLARASSRPAPPACRCGWRRRRCPRVGAQIFEGIRCDSDPVAAEGPASSRVQPRLASRTSLRLGRRSSSSRISASSSRMG